MPEKIPVSFGVQMYGQLHPYPDNPSKMMCRVRTFYKGLNRNHTYFGDEVSEYMISHIVANPIVGYYDEEKQDFTQHFTIDKTKAYGCIPNPSGFAWETHLDEDGIERIYACFDVVLYTDRYPEAVKIVDCAQSIEINPHTSSGNWTVINGEYVFNYSFAEIYGLCALGKDYKPCFEGAAFYSLNNNEQEAFISYVSKMKEEIRQNFSMLSNDKTVQEEKGGKQIMPMKLNLPQDSKFELLFQAMNTNYNEEHEYTVDYMVHNVTENDFCAYSCGDGKNYRVNYSMNEDGKIELGDSVEVSLLNFTQSEMENENAKVSHDDYEAKVNEFTNTINELNGKIDEFEKANYQTIIDDLTEKNSTLEEKLKNFEALEVAELNEKKQEVINSYSRQLTEEEIAEVVTHKDDYSLEELDGKLAIIFAHKMREVDNNIVPNNFTGNKDSLVQLLEKYKNKGE